MTNSNIMTSHRRSVRGRHGEPVLAQVGRGRDGGDGLREERGGRGGVDHRREEGGVRSGVPRAEAEHQQGRQQGPVRIGRQEGAFE